VSVIFSLVVVGIETSGLFPDEVELQKRKGCYNKWFDFVGVEGCGGVGGVEAVWCCVASCDALAAL
jgi:hypothetical protein